MSIYLLLYDKKLIHSWLKQCPKVIKLSVPFDQIKTFFDHFQLKPTKKPSKLRVFSIKIKKLDYALFSTASIKT